MYATCLFCAKPLGANEAIEHFPVGRRLAFDAAQGRLWVVCGACGRWNLSPFDTRWEAIEEAERLFRATRTRVSTDNIGLARVADRTELVRIGAPLRPEFAAWRWGDQLVRRRRKYWLSQATSILLPATTFAGAMAPQHLAITTSAGGIALAGMLVRDAYEWRARRTPWLRLRGEDGVTQLIGPTKASNARIEVDRATRELRVGLWTRTRRLRHWERLNPLTWAGLDKAQLTLTGDMAVEAAARVIPLHNEFGAGRTEVTSALEIATEELCLDTPQTTRELLTRAFAPERRPNPRAYFALEIALHENDERRALEGELAELEARWRDADALARIADSLTIPAEIDDRLQSMRAAHSLPTQDS